MRVVIGVGMRGRVKVDGTPRRTFCGLCTCFFLTGVTSAGAASFVSSGARSDLEASTKVEALSACLHLSYSS